MYVTRLIIWPKQVMFVTLVLKANAASARPTLNISLGFVWRSAGRLIQGPTFVLDDLEAKIGKVYTWKFEAAFNLC